MKTTRIAKTLTAGTLAVVMAPVDDRLQRRR